MSRTRRRLQSPVHSGDTGPGRSGHQLSPAQPQPSDHDHRASAPPVNHQSPASSGLQNEERSGMEIASAALGKPERVGQVPYYTGNQVPLLLTPENA